MVILSDCQSKESWTGIIKKNMEIDNLTNAVNEIQNENRIKSDKYAALEDEVKKHKKDIDNEKEEVQTLQGLISKSDDSVKNKEKDILKLKELLEKD